MSAPIQLVIPAAGLGSRFKDVGVLTPKPLILISGIPMIIWVISNFNLSPADSALIVCQKADGLPQALEKYISQFPFSIRFVEIEGLTSGPASTLELIMHQLSPDIPLIVANSDQYVSKDLSKFVMSVRNRENSGTILTMQASGEKWSYIGRDVTGKIVEVVEKKEISNEATVGIYAWLKPILLEGSIQFLKAEKLLVNGEYYVAPSYGYLIEQELSIGVFSVGSHGTAVHGLGTPQDLQEFLEHPEFDQFRNRLDSFLKSDT